MRRLEKTVLLGKAEGHRRRGSPNMRWVDSAKEARRALSLQDMSEDVSARTFWRTGIHRITVSQKRLGGT